MRIEEATIALKVAQHLSFSLAAEQLSLANSKVTRVITNLEQEYGHALFSRTTRRMSITPYGEVFLRHAQRIVTQEDNLRMDLRALEKGKSGTLEVGYSGNVMSDILPMTLSYALAALPSIQISPRFAWSQEITRNLQEGNIDVGYVSRMAPVEGLESMHIVDKEIYFIVPESHRLAGKDYCEFNDVLDESFIVGPYDKWHLQRLLLDRYFGRHNRPYKVAFVTDDPVSMEVMVQMGMGISINYELPDTPLRPGIVKIPVHGELSNIPVYVQWRMSNSNPSVRPFINMLEQMKSEVFPK